MFGALKRGRFRSLASLILAVNVVGELQQKRTLAASRGFLAAARLSCWRLTLSLRKIDNYYHAIVFHHIWCKRYTWDINMRQNRSKPSDNSLMLLYMWLLYTKSLLSLHIMIVYHCFSYWVKLIKLYHKNTRSLHNLVKHRWDPHSTIPHSSTQLQYMLKTHDW